ncbi:Stress responsive A/B Barrel Domain protein [Rubripirellula lacrimiformis]|uniref:Stress responsive A/B Barrel Domain protein n=1 Tax=Rubripirellula lacrimiformis TaxID=1930273 RepID=A0A517N4C4_9BACT|nr:Dabb family protein [Rubripirellula lacrimiformis]QDT01983.1 Stress responsive A/B Barrel Domain protein [Rubripirellula lacrimiformis]
MFYHSVHFWLRDGVGEAERQQVIEGVKSLGNSPNMESARVGVPAMTDRAVVDNSYSIQLIAVFADKAAHDRYQSTDDEVHQAFIANFKPYWTKVVIYDSLDA